MAFFPIPSSVYTEKQRLRCASRGEVFRLFCFFFKSFKQCDHGVCPQVPMVMGGRWHGFRVCGDQHHLHVHLQVHIKKKR